LTRIIGFEPIVAILKTAVLNHYTIPSKVGLLGVEPKTIGLKDHCSTIEL
jgi:hypothetical protein